MDISRVSNHGSAMVNTMVEHIRLNIGGTGGNSLEVGKYRWHVERIDL